MANELAGVKGRMKYGLLFWMLQMLSAVVWGQDSSFVEYRFAEGEVSSRGMLVDGIPSGYWTSFHEDGTRKSEGNWLSGDLVGEWVFYDGQGRIQTTLNYSRWPQEMDWSSSGIHSARLITLTALGSKTR